MLKVTGGRDETKPKAQASLGSMLESGVKWASPVRKLHNLGTTAKDGPVLYLASQISDSDWICRAHAFISRGLG